MKYFLSAAIALSAGLLLFYGGVGGRKAPSGGLETKKDDRPPVTVEVTPTELGRTAKEWQFRVAYTTHSGGLNKDPAKVAVLLNDKGAVNRPTAWEGPGPGGHHISGVLKFKAIKPTPSFVVLKIMGVGGVRERSFKWKIE